MVDKSKYQVDKLLAIMAKLRHPNEGCEWDLAQNFKTVAPYTIEEAYEVAQAIELDDMQQLKSELGDLLFQVVFHSQMAEEQGEFGFNEVVEQLIDKLQRRHPHVFKKQAIGKGGSPSQRPAVVRGQEGPGTNRIPKPFDRHLPGPAAYRA